MLEIQQELDELANRIDASGDNISETANALTENLLAGGNIYRDAKQLIPLMEGHLELIDELCLILQKLQISEDA